MKTAIRATPVVFLGVAMVSYAQRAYKWLTEPEPGFEDKPNPRVFLDLEAQGTPLGRVVCELRSDVVPRTAENFRALCTHEHGYGYRGSRFHRIKPGFCLHGGDFRRDNGEGGLSIYGKFFKDENFELVHDRPGVLTMANSGPDTNNSQFVITTGEQGAKWLDGEHVAFGHVVDGMDVVLRAESFGSDTGTPAAVVRIIDSGELAVEVVAVEAAAAATAEDETAAAASATSDAAAATS